MLAYSYLRFSHPSQAKGDSIRRQTKATEDWCERNGVPLDSVTAMSDHGSSAYTPELRQNDRYALANFLRQVETGRIPRGSFLIIENLDRLSREEEVQACHTLTGILLAGVKVVQLTPELVLTDKSSGFDIMRAVMELARGHGESKMKSERIGQARQNKKSLARKDGLPMTNMIPSWLRLRDGGFEIVEPRARIIRWIYDLAIDGLGNRQILRKLESDKVPAFTRSKKWGLPYLSHILKSRTVLGELQPMERKKRALKPDGDPIPNYYPAIIDERTWLLARAAREERQKHRGRHGEYVNPFAGLLRDAVHGGPFYANNNGNGKWIKRYLINYEGNQGREKITTFPFGIFERCILERLREVPASALLAQPGSADEIAALSAERAEKENRLRAIQDALRESGKPVKSLAVVAEELEDEIADLGRLIEEATNRADLSDAQVWGDATTLMGILESGTEEEKREKRLRLRAILRRTIHSIYIVVASLEGKSDRVCIAQAFFVNSKKYRAYVIWYKRGSRMRPEERSECMDFPHKARHLDLRSRAQAAELQREFAASPSPFA